MCPSIFADDPAAAWIEKADALKLHEERYWHILLHYEKSLTGTRSLIDDPNFFNAPDGRTHPRQELHATLRAFLQPPTDPETDHPVCRFNARFHWLVEQLEIDLGQLPRSHCDAFREVYEEIDPSTTALVFPAAYMNSPASIFGHTLIVFDSKGRNRLLSKAATYGVVFEGPIGLLAAFGTMLGSFKGFYTVLPYYEKVEEYGDLNHRDIWEYELDFNAEEIERMIRHTWELQNVYSKYYFYTENCSYNLFFLFEAARPSLRLREQFKSWVIPIDTVKAVKELGIIRDVAWRPSPSMKILHLASFLTPEQQQLAIRTAERKIEPGEIMERIEEPEARLIALEVAAEFLQFKYTEKEVSKADYTKNLLKILKLRAKLGRPDEAIMNVPEPDRPENGHDPKKLSLGVGVDNRSWFQSLRFRPAYHGLSDPGEGYTTGSQIELAGFDLRYHHERDTFEFERFDFMDAWSLTPRDAFFKPPAWHLQLGARQMDVEDDEDRLVAQAVFGYGRAYEHPALGLVYGLIETDVQVSGSYSRSYAVGFGPSIGLIRNVGERMKSRLQAKASFFDVGEDFFSHKVSLDHQFYVSRDLTVNLELSNESNDGFDRNTATLFLNWMF
ncbi:MAG: DUF4105 domain-containing protein [Verrucomicrobiota bacterium]